MKRTKTEKQWLYRWEELVKNILDTTDIDDEEPEEEKEQRMMRLEAEPEEWFRYYFPRFAFATPAVFHREATKRVLENKEWFEVRMWSRELAKSTRTMMEVLYLVLVGHPEPGHSSGSYPARYRKRYVLMVSNSFDNAIRLLMPYKANLEYNRRILKDYGLQEHAGSWQSGEFITQQGAAFRAIGVGQSPRGTRNEEVRPDVIIFDDVDTDADCLNTEQVHRKWRWIEEAAIGTRSVSQPTTIIFCGNRIALDCCVQRAVNVADHVEEISIRDKQGNSVWPEKNTETDIDRVLSQKSYAAQQKEYFNNPVTEGSVFKKMAYKPVRPLDEYRMLVCYTDPSYKDTNDYKATVLVGRWENEYHIIRCFLDRATTAQMIRWHYRIMDEVKDAACYYYMEDVFMQDVILREVANAGTRTGRNIPILPDRRKKADKYTRIECLLEPLHRNGQLYFNVAEKDNPHMLRLAEQFVAFAPGGRAHDDGPDAVEGAVWILDNKVRGEPAIGISSFRSDGGTKRF